ncbi:Hypothetical predicted protein [Mytilus galloprovincialis]|uniref:Apple domain-containing protein n=1 Tax=Mytilus galloprovincialis TaxID=29158 RepID=A0A8B6DXR5_MYTGA|nr:Hypothetical predicted protein [Mytilus galloprovincialis]
MTITFQNRDKYLPGRSFVNNTANSIYQCMDICYRFNYCKSVNFVKELHVCVMNLEDTSTLSLIPMVGSIYEERPQFPQDLVPQDCVGHSCPVEDLCVANGTCANWLYVDCGELEDKKAIIEYEYTVGYAEAKFQCKRPLPGQIGKETFYCLMSGKWGGPNVQCGLYCYEPPMLRPEQEVIYKYVGTAIYANYKCTSYPDPVSTPSCAVSRCTAPDTWVPASLSCHGNYLSSNIRA